MPPQFHGPRLKIERAKQHINDLQSRIRQFEAGDLYSLCVQTNPQTGNDVLEATVTQSVPDDFGLIIGDALHNLKAALDFAVNEVVFIRLGEFDDYTRFPVRDNRQKLEAAVTGGKISQASKAVASFIVDSVKSYEGGNEAMWALHRLNILDKHRLLLPVMQINGISNIRIKHDRGENLMGTWIITRTRTVRHEVGWRNCEIANKGNASLLVLFDKGLPLAGAPIVPTLIEFTKHVIGVLDGIETVFSNENTHSQL